MVVVHANRVVVDDAHVLASSANATGAAHQRKIQAAMALGGSRIGRPVRIVGEILRERDLLPPAPSARRARVPGDGRPVTARAADARAVRVRTARCAAGDPTDMKR